jgi:hypothetical protein
MPPESMMFQQMVLGQRHGCEVFRRSRPFFRRRAGRLASDRFENCRRDLDRIKRL